MCRVRCAIAFFLALGCDPAPHPTAPAHEPGQPELGSLSSAARTTNPGVTAYWRRLPNAVSNEPELWLYRNEPELGFNAHLPAHFSWVTRQSLGSTLIRHAIYWHVPLQDAVAQLHDAVASAPDGATLLVVVHSKDVCVDHAVAGDRTAKYQAFAEYVRALAAAVPRTGRVRVLYWQIYNEQNYPGWTNFFGGPRMTGSDTTCAGDGVSEYEQGRRYAELLRYAYPAIKEATNDSGWVVMGALGSIDTSTNVYSTTGRYAFLHGMYAGGAKDYYDIAAIQPYGKPGVLGIRRTSDFDRALAVYGDETRPVFMTEFGSKEPPATQWPDLLEQIESARSTRLYGKAFVYIVCGGSDEPYSLRGSASGTCDAPTESFLELGARQYNASLYGVDSVIHTDVVIRGARSGLEPIGYAVSDEGAQFRIHDVPVHVREPTRVRFRQGTLALQPMIGVQYRAFLERYGWTEWVTDSAAVGAVGFSLPIHAVQVRAVNSTDVRALSSVFQEGTWGAWLGTGAIAGDTTTPLQSYRGMLVDAAGRPASASLCYQTRSMDGAWSQPGCDGSTDGDVRPTVGIAALRLWMTQDR